MKQQKRILISSKEYKRNQGSKFLVYGFCLVFLTILGWGCGKEKSPPVPSEPEMITTVRLVFTESQGLPFHVDYRVIDGDLTVDTIRLKANRDYELELRFLNEYAQPTEDITEEIIDESTTHLVISKSIPEEAIEWISGNTDTHGEPLNQRREIRTAGPMEAELSVWLMHLPTNKYGLHPGSSGGETDAQALFPLLIIP